MNKTAIKNFAVRARVQLIEGVRQRAFEYEITEHGDIGANPDAVGGRLLTAEEKQQRRQLTGEIHRRGFAQVMEEAAYTWFNRFIALRFMEVNGFLPSRVRVFTDETGAFRPEILKEALTAQIDGLDRNRVLELLDRQNNEELYKYLLITQCNALNRGLPGIFEKISNWTELLFPANLLRPDSVIGQMVSQIPQEDWRDEVQVIGWLYQYYNSDLKDETFALLKKNIKITKDRIPAATQLFTPDWIVRYLVENALGRLWAQGHPEFDRQQWQYYLDEAAQEPEVERQLQQLRRKYADIRPEEIKVMDPCMGSGHILVYAFDVLLQIYTSCGWSERDAAKSIVENNLYGLDIDARAGQLACFAIMMKARKYNRRILNGETRPHVLAIQDSGFMTEDFIRYVAGNDQNLLSDLNRLRGALADAKEYGSIVHMPELNYAALYDRIHTVSRSAAEDLFRLGDQNAVTAQLLPLVKQAEVMARKYDVVVTNPPYMGASGMSSKLGEFVKKHYPDSKSDLFAVFIEKCGRMLKAYGYQAMITQHAWMFLSSYEKLRTKLLACDTLNMIHLGARAFEEIGGEVVQTTGFVLRNVAVKGYRGTYCRLVDPTTQDGKKEMFLSGKNRYHVAQSIFCALPGAPVAYWASPAVVRCFANHQTLDDCAFPRQGLATGNNERFLRMWSEVDASTVMRNAENHAAFFASGKKYVPYNKGGTFRKWFANMEWLIRFDKPHYDMLQTAGNHLPSKEFYFRESITWSKVTSGGLSMRYIPQGSVFDVAGCSIFAHENLHYILAFTNTKIMQHLIGILSQTLNYEVGSVKSIPLILCQEQKHNIEQITCENLRLSKQDLDAFETSRDFQRHPLI